MPSNQPSRDWRQGQPSPAKSSAPRWRRAEKAGPRRPISKKAKRIAALFSLGGLIGLLVVIILYIKPPQPTRLVLCGAPFDTNLGIPTDVYGWNTLQDLTTVANKGKADTSWFQWKRGNLNLSGTGPEMLSPEWLQGNTWWDSKEPTVLLYIAAHGGVDTRGAFLFYEDSHKAIKRLYIQDLLARFGEDGPKKKDFVLLLDATQVDACPAQGQLFNDFTRKLADEVKDRNLNNLWILCSSSPNQRSWVSEEWQQSVFGHFVVECLKGAYASGGKITLADLRATVVNKVEAWVSENRNAVQEPMLLGNAQKADAILLCQAPEQPASEQPSAEDREKDTQTILAEMRPLWTERDGLAGATPSPAVYSPYVWRRYQDTLLRYEELVRAGDPTQQTGQGKPLREELKSLKGKVDDERQLLRGGFSSLTNNLAMPAAVGAGQGSSQPASLRRDFDAWYEDPAAAKLTDYRQQARERWPVEGDRLLLDTVLKLLGNPNSQAGAILKTAQQRLRTLERSTQAIRPVEAHFLWMLAQYTEPRELPPSALLLQALKVSRQAEETALAVAPRSPLHPYSEVVYPCIREQIEKADRERRQGENRVFGSKALWDQARQHLSAAAALYDQAAADAKIIRGALAARDQAAAELPYYTAWLARLEASPDGWPRSDTQTPALWQDVHRLNARLTALLAKPDVAALRPSDGNEGLNELTDRITDRINKIGHAFTQRLATLVGQNAVLSQTYREQIASVLSIPLVPVNQRLKLLSNLRQISAGQNQATQQHAAPASADAAAQILAQARRHGTLAAALLGISEDKNVQEGLTPSPDRQQDYSRLHAAGATIEDRWQGRSTQVRQQFKKAWQQPDPAAALALLRQADSTCRFVDGAASVDLEPCTPADAYHRANLQGLLLWLAQRTADDHWWGESPTATESPYYSLAGRAFANDALELAKVGDPRDKLPKAWKQGANDLVARVFQKPTGLHVDRIDAATVSQKTPRVPSEPGLTVTDEDTFDVAYRLRADEGMPAGCEPLAWLSDVGGKLTLAQPDQERDIWSRLPQLRRYTLRHKDADKQVGVGFNSNAGPTAAKVAFHAFYRGQKLNPETPITFYLKPDIVAYHYPPKENKAQVAALADSNVAEGTVEIVLDGSGSMGAKDFTGTSECKFNHARDALRQVLHDVPPTMKIGLWLFRGQDESSSEIQQIQTPKTLTSEAIDQLINKLAEKAPRGTTPLLKTMNRAKQDLEREATGLRTLLVLTDGNDNEWGGPGLTAQQRNRAVRQNLEKEFANSGIFVSVLLFQTTNEEERQNAQEQFGDLNNWRHGQWVDTGYGERMSYEARSELLRRLKAALLPRLDLYGGNRHLDASPFIDFGGVAGARKLIEWSKPFAAGAYRAELYGGQISRPLDLKNDDQLLLRFRRTDTGTGGISLEREIYGRLPDSTGKPHDEKPGWLATVLNSQVRTHGGFGVLQVALEDTQNRGQVGTIRQIRPGLTWVEVTPEGATDDPTPVWWGNFSSFPAPLHLACPAPAWDVLLPGWPTVLHADEGKLELRPAKLTMWCCSEAAVDDVRQRDVPVDAQNLKQVRGEADLAGEKIVIESVTREEQEVVVSKEPDQAPKREKRSCLVVRLRYQDEPIWVNLRGANDQLGSEHCFYRKAHRATALFWGKHVDQGQGFRLQLLSLRDFKDRATKLEPPSIRLHGQDE